MACAILYENRLHLPGFYHATQAVEKYFKALAMSIVDPTGKKTEFSWMKGKRGHDLVYLAGLCSKKSSIYLDRGFMLELKRFSEFDQTARYPWPPGKLSNGFNSADFEIYALLFRYLRNDIPIEKDDFPLGLAVRGYYHRHPEHKVNDPFTPDRLMITNALSKILRPLVKIEELVRWD